MEGREHTKRSPGLTQNARRRRQDAALVKKTSVFDDVDEDHYTAELENWHEFVKDTCGVKLTVRAVRETDSQS